MDRKAIEKKKKELEESLNNYSKGSATYNSVTSELIRVVLEEFNNNSNEYSKKLINLAQVNIGIALIMLIAIFFQISLIKSCELQARERNK